MTRMTLRRDDVVVGVDTHKDEHAAVLLDGHGGTLTELVVPATTGGSPTCSPSPPATSDRRAG